MSSPENSTIRNQYGSFLLAATAYIAGILLFLFWSYSANRSALIQHTDKSLEDAAFAIQEILTIDSTTNLTVIERSQQHDKLVRMAEHSDFSTIGAVEIEKDLVTTLITSSSPNTIRANQLNEGMPLPSNLQKKLIKLGNAAQSGTTMFTVKSPADSTLRYAILYKAKGPEHGTAFLVAQEDRILRTQLAHQVLRLSIAGIGMLLLAIPLILLFSRTRKKAAAELSDMNIRLQHDVELQKTRETELKDAISDLERFNAVTAGRESRIIELKAEINALLAQMNRDKRYNIEHTD
ncbi:hypothetical protein P4B35_21235 [Pontiellaceae bacterium B12227]|nr:hypothetical protein [Pontiellaceae bacterium B12227]